MKLRNGQQRCADLLIMAPAPVELEAGCARFGINVSSEWRCENNRGPVTTPSKLFQLPMIVTRYCNNTSLLSLQNGTRDSFRHTMFPIYASNKLFIMLRVTCIIHSTALIIPAL